MTLGRNIHHGDPELAAIIPTKFRCHGPVEQRRIILAGKACGRITVEGHALVCVGEEMVDMA